MEHLIILNIENLPIVYIFGLDANYNYFKLKSNVIKCFTHVVGINCTILIVYVVMLNCLLNMFSQAKNDFII